MLRIAYPNQEGTLHGFYATLGSSSSDYLSRAVILDPEDDYPFTSYPIGYSDKEVIDTSRAKDGGRNKDCYNLQSEGYLIPESNVSMTVPSFNGAYTQTWTLSKCDYPGTQSVPSVRRIKKPSSKGWQTGYVLSTACPINWLTSGQHGVILPQGSTLFQVSEFSTNVQSDTDYDNGWILHPHGWGSFIRAGFRCIYRVSSTYEGDAGGISFGMAVITSDGVIQITGNGVNGSSAPNPKKSWVQLDTARLTDLSDPVNQRMREFFKNFPAPRYDYFPKSAMADASKFMHACAMELFHRGWANRIDLTGRSPRFSRKITWTGDRSYQPELHIQEARQVSDTCAALTKILAPGIDPQRPLLAQKCIENVPSSNVNAIAFARDLPKFGDTIKAILKLVKQPSNPKNWASAFLSAQYGDKLTVADMKELYKSLKPALERYKKVAGSIITSRSRLNQSMPRTYPPGTASSAYKIWYKADANDAKVRSILHDMGFRLNAKNAWDLIPFSFVVDWVVDISTMLSTFDAKLERNRLGYRLQSCIRSQRVEFTSFGEFFPNGYKGFDVSAAGGRYYLRTVTKQLDPFEYRTDVSLPSAIEFLTGGALFIQLRK